MLRLIGLAVSIGLADSVNPSTIAPGLYLAMGQRPRVALIQFTLAVFAVNFVGGVAIALGPGEALLALVPKPSATTRYILETLAGAVILISAVVLWRKRKSLARRELPAPAPERKSALVLGLTISAVELPTAFPYFAVIAAVVGSGFGPGRQLFLLALYNVAFLLPLILMILTVTIAPDRAGQILRRARDWLQRHWPPLLASLALIVGLFVITLGITGLTGQTHGRFGRLSRRFRHSMTP
ncbi:MAG: GAP family protein [Solirubrobacterales bacterium]|nr:GAP family protein [Solirubrobacterales bacterium]MBV9941971.1 GAP family protein [Solirubrobacterales bacterium]